MTRARVRPKFTAVILREKQSDSTRGVLLLGSAALVWLVITAAWSPLTPREVARAALPRNNRWTVRDVGTGRAALDTPNRLYRPLPELLRRVIRSPRPRRFFRLGLLVALAGLLAAFSSRLEIGSGARDPRLWATFLALPLTFTALREPGSEDVLQGFLLALSGAAMLQRRGRLRTVTGLGTLSLAGLCYEAAPLAVALGASVLGRRARITKSALAAFALALGVKFLAVGSLWPHPASWRWGGSHAFAAGRAWLFLMIEGPVKLLWPGFDLGGDQPGWAFVLAGVLLLAALLHGGRPVRRALAGIALALVPLGAAPQARAAALLPVAGALVAWALGSLQPRRREFLLAVGALLLMQGMLILWPAEEGRGERRLGLRIGQLNWALDQGVPARALRGGFESLKAVSPTLPGLPALEMRILFGEGRSGEALLAARRARTLDPWDRRSRWFLAEYARVRRRGNREEVLLREILRSCHGPADAPSADRALSRLVELVRTGFADPLSVQRLLERKRIALSDETARDVEAALEAL